MPHRVVIYARLSVTTDESVSIARQVESARKYAEARQWVVVGEYIDDGVSATRSKPEERHAWRNLLYSEEPYDAVIIWRVDRLARRVLDFLHAHETLHARNAGIVAVEDPIDMTTPQGRAFAVMLAVFGEMEAAAISLRVKSARDHLIQSGRVVGGTVPYGWRSIPNPDGSGRVLTQDPERVVWVRAMADRALRGDTIYSISRWLDSEGAPLPTTSQATRKGVRWNYSTVERLLRNPILAGMTPHNPGRGRRDPADPSAVLRDARGLPIVDHKIAILTGEERRLLLTRLDSRDTPQARPRAAKGTTSPLLSRLAVCEHCERTMHRGTTQGRPSLSCPECHQVVSRRQLDQLVLDRLLAERGHVAIWNQVEKTEDRSPELAEIEEAVSNTTKAMARDDADLPSLMERLSGLKAMRAKARANAPVHRHWTVTSQTVGEALSAATNDYDRREVLNNQITRLSIRRGGTGRRLDPKRVTIEWLPMHSGIPLPDGLRMTEPLNGAPKGRGVVGPAVVRLPDQSILATTSRA